MNTSRRLPTTDQSEALLRGNFAYSPIEIVGHDGVIMSTRGWQTEFNGEPFIEQNLKSVFASRFTPSAPLPIRPPQPQALRLDELDRREIQRFENEPLAQLQANPGWSERLRTLPQTQALRSQRGL
jgi:hypothetical protein